MANSRVLVADDHDETRERIAGLLGAEFDVVLSVADGQAAVEATWGASSRCRRTRHLDAQAQRLQGGGHRTCQMPPGSSSPPSTMIRASSQPLLTLGASALVLKRNMWVELVPAVRRALSFHAVYFYEDELSLSRTVAAMEERPGGRGRVPRESLESAHRKTQVLAALWLLIGRGRPGGLSTRSVSSTATSYPRDFNSPSGGRTSSGPIVCLDSRSGGLARQVCVTDPASCCRGDAAPWPVSRCVFWRHVAPART
jgi:CheY-like chemotaxis protein